MEEALRFSRVAGCAQGHHEAALLKDEAYLYTCICASTQARCWPCRCLYVSCILVYVFTSVCVELCSTCCVCMYVWIVLYVCVYVCVFWGLLKKEGQSRYS